LWALPLEKRIEPWIWRQRKRGAASVLPSRGPGAESARGR
jgi:hypothetical protein